MTTASPTAVALLATPTPIQLVQVIALSAIPLGLFLIVTKTRSMMWTDLLRSLGVLVVPLILVLTINDVLHPMASTMALGLVMAYMMGIIDTD